MMTLLGILSSFLIVVLAYMMENFIAFVLPDILADIKFKRGYEERTIVREDMYVVDGRWQHEIQNAAKAKVRVVEFKNKTNYPNWTHKRQEVIEQSEWVSIKDFKTDGLTRTNYGII
jgi:hypothetical protein